MHLVPPPADNKAVMDEVMRMDKLDQAEEENRREDVGVPAEMKEWSKRPK